MRISDHLRLEIATAVHSGRPLEPGAPVPGCGCPACTGVPEDHPARQVVPATTNGGLSDRVLEIARAVSIIEIAQRLGLDLQRAARGEFKATCPFHDEKTPSFFVVPAKGMYHCFGCGRSGDGISLLMRLRGLSFPDAVRELAGVRR